MNDSRININKGSEFYINISDFTGFQPAYYANAWSAYGNKGQANSMTDIDISDPNILTQGSGKAALTAGTQAGAVTTLISSILKTPTSSGVAFACGGAKLYKISSTAVTNDGTYPMTIDKGTVTGEDATDLVNYKGNVYTFYNHSGSAGDIAKLTVATNTLDADWGSTTPTGFEALASAPHYAIVGGDDIMYFTNGYYIGYYDGSTDTLETQGLDFHTDGQAIAITWNNNSLRAGVNRPNITGSNFNESAIYTWNGISSSWEGDPVEVPGKIGALYTKNGTTFVWWQDVIGTGGYNLGYISGGSLVSIRRYDGSLPNQAQVGECYGFIMWLSGDDVFLWGSPDKDVHTRMFHYMTCTYGTGGAISAPFGTIMLSSNATTNYILEKESGYSIASTYKTTVLNMSDARDTAYIDRVVVGTEQMSTGAKCDINLVYDQGKTTKALDQIAYSTANKTRHKILHKAVPVEDFRLELSWANGSATNPVKIRNIFIGGYYKENN